MNHEARYEAAIDAASYLHGDPSVPLKETLESLQGLREHIDCLIDAVKGDIKRKDQE